MCCGMLSNQETTQSLQMFPYFWYYSCFVFQSVSVQACRTFISVLTKGLGRFKDTILGISKPGTLTSYEISFEKVWVCVCPEWLSVSSVVA